MPSAFTTYRQSSDESSGQASGGYGAFFTGERDSFNNFHASSLTYAAGRSNETRRSASIEELQSGEERLSDAAYNDKPDMDSRIGSQSRSVRFSRTAADSANISDLPDSSVPQVVIVQYVKKNMLNTDFTSFPALRLVLLFPLSRKSHFSLYGEDR